MLAPIASDTRSPFNAGSETKAWSVATDRPAVTRMAPRSLRSRWATWDSHRCASGGCAPPGALDDASILGVAVEADDRAQASSDGGAGPAVMFEVASEALDVDPAYLEQAAVVLAAPGGELAQVQGVGVTGEAVVAGQEPEQRHPPGAARRDGP